MFRQATLGRLQQRVVDRLSDFAPRFQIAGAGVGQSRSWFPQLSDWQNHQMV
jgi:hypothetical protein